jgi:hypothetical protein
MIIINNKTNKNNSCNAYYSFKKKTKCCLFMINIRKCLFIFDDHQNNTEKAEKTHDSTDSTTMMYNERFEKENKNKSFLQSIV